MPALGPLRLPRRRSTKRTSQRVRVIARSPSDFSSAPREARAAAVRASSRASRAPAAIVPARPRRAPPRARRRARSRARGRAVRCRSAVRGSRSRRRAPARASSSDVRARARRSSTSCSRAGDASIAEAYERRKNARSSSCDFTASFASRYGANRAIERGEIAELLPDAAERGQRRLVPLVERVVGVGAQPLQPVGVAEDLAGRRQLVVFARLRRDAIDLGQLERTGIPRAVPSRARRVASRSRSRRATAAARTPRPRRSRSSVSPANASSRSRCDAGSSSTWCSCWPWRSTRPRAQLAQRRARHQRAVDEGAAAAPGRDVAADDQLARRRGLEDGFDRRRAPLRSARDRPTPGRRRAARRRRRGSTCPRRSRPVRTFRPGSNSSSRRSMTARWRMERKRSTARSAILSDG